jgi:cytochrome c2
MAFAGIANAKDRGDVIAYLKANAWSTRREQREVI